MSNRRVIDRRTFLASLPALAGLSTTASAGGGARTFEVVTTERGELFYRLVVRGDVEKAELTDRIGAGSNDVIVAGNDPATSTVLGYTGNAGYGDAYTVDGEIVSFRATGGDADYFLRLDGRRVTPYEVGDPYYGPGMRRHEFRLPSWLDGPFAVVGTAWGEVHYRFTVRGDAEPIDLTDRISGGSNDVIVSGNDSDTVTVRGFTGNPGYGDAFAVQGELLSIAGSTNTDEYVFRVRGRDLSFDRLVRQYGP